MTKLEKVADDDRAMNHLEHSSIYITLCWVNTLIWHRHNNLTNLKAIFDCVCVSVCL